MLSPAQADDRRLKLLRMLELPDDAPDEALNRLARVASVATNSSAALIAFPGPDRTWIPARSGWMPPSDRFLDEFCAQTVQRGVLTEISDAGNDSRLRDTAFAGGESVVRSCVGHPVLFDGTVLGTLCVFDREPRTLSVAERTLLADLAGLVNDALKRRHHRLLLAQSEERYRLLWQATTDVILLVDDCNKVKFASPALTDVFGFSAEEIIGEDFSTLVPSRLRSAYRRTLSRYVRSGAKRVIWRGVETTGLHRDGYEFPVEVSLSDIGVDGDRYFAAFMRDTSKRT